MEINYPYYSHTYHSEILGLFGLSRLLQRIKMSISKLMSQRYVKRIRTASLEKLYGRHHEFVDKYSAILHVTVVPHADQEMVTGLAFSSRVRFVFFCHLSCFVFLILILFFVFVTSSYLLWRRSIYLLYDTTTLLDKMTRQLSF